MPEATVLIAVVINSGEQAIETVLSQNRLTYEEVKRFSDLNNNSNLIFYPILCENLPKKHAGVGLARKIGMDLAIHHFKSTSKSRGIIISLDADCSVSQNFLLSIHNEFISNNKLNATIHNFHHRIEDNKKEIDVWAEG